MKFKGSKLLILTLCTLIIPMTQPVHAGSVTSLEVGDEFIYELETFEFEVLLDGENYADKGRYESANEVSIVIDGFGLDYNGPKARINETVNNQTEVYVTYFDSWFDMWQEGAIYAFNTYGGYPNGILFTEPTAGLTLREESIIPFLVTNQSESYYESLSELETLDDDLTSGYPNNNASATAILDNSTTFFQFTFLWQSADSTLRDDGLLASFHFDYFMQIEIDIKRSIVTALDFSFYNEVVIGDHVKSRNYKILLNEVRDPEPYEKYGSIFIIGGSLLVIIMIIRLVTRRMSEIEKIEGYVDKN